MMNIVACASDNYTMQCGVMFYSVCKNNPDEEICFYIITDDQFSDKHKDDIRQTVSAFPKKRVEFVQVRDEQVDSFLQFENPYYTRHVFYRLLMAELLPRTVNKALYLDCDIIVRHNICELWNIDISDTAIACVRDSVEGQIERFNRLGYPYEKGYFNSGMLLANLDYWRKNDANKRFLRFIKEHSSLISMPDQDVLNAVFVNEKQFVNFTYNFQSEFLFKPRGMQFEYVKYKEQLDPVRTDPVVLHFSGARPWTSGCLHPYKEEFFKYRLQTMWKAEPLWPNKRKLKQRLFDALRKPLHSFGVSLKENYFDYSLKLKDH